MVGGRTLDRTILKKKKKSNIAMTMCSSAIFSRALLTKSLSFVSVDQTLSATTTTTTTTTTAGSRSGRDLAATWARLYTMNLQINPALARFANFQRRQRREKLPIYYYYYSSNPYGVLLKRLN